jgi:DHA2 family multidrug resistance protein
MALSPGGLLVMCMLPFVGFALGKIEARWIIMTGLAVTAFALYHMTTFNTQMDFRHAVIARCIQGAGLALLFVPINTAAYAFVPRNKNNAASGLINLARNIGGSVGISLVTTMLARRAQFHQARLGESATSLNPIFNQHLSSTARAIVPPPGSKAPYAVLMQQLMQQANTLSYVDCFYVLSLAFGLMIPLVLLMKKTRPGRAAAAH